MNAINMKQAEARRLAAHLTATVSYLWIKSLLAILLGATLLADRPRPPNHRADRSRTHPRGGGILPALGGSGADRQ